MDDGTGVGEGSGASPRFSLSFLNSTSLIALVGGTAFLFFASVGRRVIGASTGDAPEAHDTHKHPTSTSKSQCILSSSLRWEKEVGNAPCPSITRN